MEFINYFIDNSFTIGLYGLLVIAINIAISTAISVGYIASAKNDKNSKQFTYKTIAICSVLMIFVVVSKTATVVTFVAFVCSLFRWLGCL